MKARMEIISPTQDLLRRAERFRAATRAAGSPPRVTPESRRAYTEAGTEALYIARIVAASLPSPVPREEQRP